MLYCLKNTTLQFDCFHLDNEMEENQFLSAPLNCLSLLSESSSSRDPCCLFEVGCCATFS